MYKAALITLLLTFQCFFSFAQEPERTVNVYYENSDNRILIYADNSEIFPQSIVVELDFKGFEVEGKQEKYYVVDGKDKKKLLIELVRKGNQKASFSYKYTYFMGDIISAKHDDRYAYGLPYHSGESFKLTQGYGGQFSHIGKKALDFTMPEGTEIVAVRDGLVIQTKEDSNEGCAEERCLTFANFITILHDDGSIAQYFHMKQNGVEVEPGDEVRQGQLIGLSGNTGFTSGPHLHFEVNMPSETGLIAIPTKFSIGGRKISLKNGETYRANN